MGHTIVTKWKRPLLAIEHLQVNERGDAFQFDDLRFVVFM